MAEHWSVLAAREYGDESLATAILAEVDAIFSDDDDSAPILYRCTVCNGLDTDHQFAPCPGGAWVLDT